MTLNIGYVYSPPWGLHPTDDNVTSGLLLDMYRAGMEELGIKYRFSYSPHLRLHQQLESGEIDMLVMSQVGLEGIKVKALCGNSFAKSSVKLYMRPGSDLAENGLPEEGARVAVPPGSERLFAGFLPEGLDYHFVRPVLMKKLFVSGRFDYLIDFEERIEMRLIADQVDFETKVVGTTNFFVCMRDEHLQARKVVTAMTNTFLTSLYEENGAPRHWERGFDILRSFSE